MSGIEFIVGTILGGVPVAVMAFEKYQTLSTAVSTFRNTREIIRMQSKVGSQRTIFRNNAIKLLSSLTNDRELVHTLMAGLANPANIDATPNPKVNLVMPDIYRNRIDGMMETFLSCKSTLDEILIIMEKITEELSRLAKAIGKGPQTTEYKSSQTKEWLSEMRGRFTLVWRKPDLVEAMEDLRNLNADFSMMTAQIVETLEQVRMTATGKALQKETVPGRPLKRAANTINQVEAYKRVRQASNILYHTLEKKWTCLSGEHESHAASICCIEPEQIKATQPIKLEVALTAQEDTSNQKSEGGRLMWLEVECADPCSQNQIAAVVKTRKSHPGFEELNNALAELSATPLMLAIPPNEQKEPDLQRKVRFNVAPSQQTSLAVPGQLPSSTTSETGAAVSQVIDLMLKPDLCGHLHSQYQLCRSNPYYLGHLGDKNMQRFSIPPVERRVCNEPKTLAAIIAWIGTSSIHRSLPLPVALNIAGLLAASVLQFHSTPWLPETWRSEDIRFFNVGGLSIEHGIQLSRAHFRVEFPRSYHSTTSQTSEASDVTLTNNDEVPTTIASGARNELLFRLGIVLLEVGFSRPWHSLREEMLQSKMLQPGRRSDYHIAERLCGILRNQMGPRYPRIIRRCISCDFGLNEPQDDLETSEELQAGFLVDVVLELQGLKERMEALG